MQSRGPIIAGLQGFKADSPVASFDAKTEITKTDDGTLASKKSLLVQSGKQVGKDAGATLDNAKDVVNDLLRK